MPQAEIRFLREQQRRWATERELDLDPADCTSKIDENLFGPLSPETRNDLERGEPAQLEADDKSGALQSLHSKAALVCNVFDYWRARGCDELSQLLHFAPGCRELRFAEVVPTGLEGLSSQVELLLTGDSTRPTALVSSFSEPYSMIDSRRPPASIEAPGVWGELSDCRDLALGLRANPRRFTSLQVTALLEQILGLTTRFGVRGFRLLYLWYEVEGHAADRHRRELDRFRMRMGGEVDFMVSTWQGLFRDIQAASPGHAACTQYLAARYFPG